MLKISAGIAKYAPLHLKMDLKRRAFIIFQEENSSPAIIPVNFSSNAPVVELKIRSGKKEQIQQKRKELRQQA